MSRYALRRIAAIAVASVLVPVPARAASTLTAPDVPAGRTAVLHRLERAESLLHLTSLAERVRLASSLAGIRPVPPPAVVPTSVSISLAPGLSPSLARPILDLLSAEQAAGRAAQAAVHAPPATLRALERAGDRLLARSLAGRDGGAVTAANRLLARANHLVDRAVLYGAALGLARAIDRAIPALAAAAQDGRASAPLAGPCDVAAALPALCVGGEGPNTYVQDAALLIDLGGDDVYRNSAGGADPVTNSLPVSVNVDLAGNDRYESNVGLTTSRTVQGGGSLGGIGILVDETGDDVYSATSTVTAVKAQGFGYAGVGILADGSGDDTYDIESTRPAFGDAQGQSRTLIGAMGLLVDDGSGHDSYRIEAAPAPLVDDQGLDAGNVVADGQGAAYIGGVSVFADDGGGDTLSVAGRAPAYPEDSTPPVKNRSVVLVESHGSGVLGGDAFSLSGGGDTTYSDVADVGRQAQAIAQGSSGILSQGLGELAGYGAMYDAGGDDSYLASTTSNVVRRVTLDDSCQCDAPQIAAYTSDVFSLVQAEANLGADSMIRDVSGNDRYVATTSTTAEVHLTDLRTSDDRTPTTVDAVALETRTLAQAESNAGSNAFLWDQAGDDTYEATASARAVAGASSASGPDPVAQADAPDTQVVSQAATYLGGYSELLDQGGRDTYRTAGSATAETQGEIEEIEPVMSIQASTTEGSQGGGTAMLEDVSDDGAADVFTATPPDPTCSGTRGQATWQDCGPGVGVGINQ